MTAIDRTPAWDALVSHALAVAPLYMRDLFAGDPDRFQRLSLRLGDLLLDYSKNRVTLETMSLLRDLARAAAVPEWVERMFAGAPVNRTEGRPALHVALRNRANTPILVDGEDVMPGVNRMLARMEQFAAAVRDGWLGHTGRPITSILHIGIGGSDLGPRMAVRALAHRRLPGLDIRFVANVDGAEIAQALDGLDPASTLVIVASKSFATAETMANAATARAWLADRLGEAAVARHFLAVTSNRDGARAFGIDPGNVFELWDWVGGRFSLWSAVGLPVALAIGFPGFVELLEGAHAMDRHFRTAPLERNLPATLALVGIWNANFLGAESHAVLPYCQALEGLPAYLAQLEMESGGKSVRRDGAPVTHPTAPILWGEVGSSGQHAFHQLLHQGTRFVPVDFIAFALSERPVGRHHDMLLANALAQGEALMRGRGEAELRAARLPPHKVMPGNRPSNTILGRRLDPHTLGMLIALYEHKIFVQCVIWGIECFDQWGVEAGKELAGRIFAELQGGPGSEHDSSTAGLIGHLRDARAPG